MKFKSINLEKWQQFERVKLDFHPRMTVLSGANGSGKTTLLRILAQHMGWPSTHVATPTKNLTTGVVEYLTRWFRGANKSHENIIGNITYSNGIDGQLVIPNHNQAAYSVSISNQQGVNCVFMPSHRQIFRYEPIGHIPVTKKTEQVAFDEVYNVAIQRHQGGGGNSASFFMKSTLIGWAIQGHGVHSGSKAIMPADDAQRSAYEGFQVVLQKLLPASLGFEEFEIRNMEIVFVCNGGNDEFLLETASGGVATIIDLAWQLFMFSRANSGEFTVIIDEAENHLHPTLQRALLPNLLSAFPTASFIVSTHSPLIIGSVKEAAVYVLRYNDEKKVVSEQLDLEDKARTATEILDEVLGVSSSLPIWVERELEVILKEATAGGISGETFATLRERLKAAGLERLLPDAVANVLEKK